MNKKKRKAINNDQIEEKKAGMLGFQGCMHVCASSFIYALRGYWKPYQEIPVA